MEEEKKPPQQPPKVCPIFWASVKLSSSGSRCIENDCAWWNKTIGRCAVLEMSMLTAVVYSIYRDETNQGQNNKTIIHKIT